MSRAWLPKLGLGLREPYDAGEVWFCGTSGGRPIDGGM